MVVMVTGGAGYIGSHVVAALRARGDSVVIIDDLSTGVSERVAPLQPIAIDLASDSAVAELDQVMRREGVSRVIHFAAKKQVAQSVAKPTWYFKQNVGGLANLLLAMESADVRSIVFSSSAAVYGDAAGEPLTESAPTVPVNPYGQTKLIGEWLIEAAATAEILSGVSLRYFNVAGAARPELGDTAALNLVPMVFERLDSGESPRIFGDDYPTRDGSCVRDFIHVVDLADAHLAALDSLDGSGHRVFNIGTGRGTTVLEMVAEILKVSGSGLTPQIEPRRLGDPAQVMANVDRAAAELGWRATRSVKEIVESAWASHEYFLGRQ